VARAFFCNQEHTMATTAADTLAAALPFLEPLAATTISLSRASPADTAKIQAAMTGVQSGITALAASDTAAQSKPIVDRIEQDACAVLTAAAGLPLPAPYNVILMVASSMLPALMSSVNLLLQHRVTVPTAAPVAAAA
jgi:hypothetical protein